MWVYNGYIVRAVNGTAVVTGDTVAYTAPGYPSDDLITVYDATGQKATASIAVGSVLMVSVKECTVARGEALDLSASGGVGTLQWRAEAGGTFIPADGNKGNKVTFRAPDQLGTYAVTVTDTALTERTVTIHVENVPLLTPKYDWLGNGHTTTELTVVGGNAPFQWSTDMGTVTPSSDGKTASFTAPGVTDREATVTVEDNSGYTATATIFIDRKLSLGTKIFSKQPEEVVQMVAQGGVAPFFWSATYGQFKDDFGNLLAPDEEGTIVNFEVSNMLMDDRITVTDATGATAKATVYVRQALSFVTQMKNAELGEKVEMEVQGGVPPYQWSSTQGSPEISGTDNQIGTIEAPEVITPSLTQAGYTITLTVTDSAGSETTGSVFVMGPMNVSKSLVEVALGGSSKFMVFGGAGSYFAMAEKGDVTVASAGNARGVVEYSPGNTKGDDTITIYDGAMEAREIAVSVSSALEPVVSPSEFEATRGTEMTLIVVHGMAPYVWNFEGANGQIENVEEDGSVVHVTVEGVSDISARLVVTSADDRQGEARIMTLSPLSISTKAASMFPGDQYTFQAVGGSGNYVWDLSPPEGSTENITAATLSNYSGPSTTFSAPASVKQGTMIVSVTDSAGAVASASIGISPMVLTTEDNGATADITMAFEPGEIASGLVILRIVGPTGKTFYVPGDSIDGITGAKGEFVSLVDLAGGELPAMHDFAVYGDMYPAMNKVKLKKLDGSGTYIVDLLILDMTYSGTAGAYVEIDGTFFHVPGLIIGSTSITVD